MKRKLRGGRKANFRGIEEKIEMEKELVGHRRNGKGILGET
jgi:hypothetical protein